MNRQGQSQKDRPHPLSLAGIVLVAGFVATRLAYRKSPVAHFLLQLASFAGFSAMLAMAAVSPFGTRSRNELARDAASDQN